jgi:hypothetical protein
MHPLGFNWIEPGALGRQWTNKDACAFSGFQTGLIVRADPVLYRSANVPAGVVSH